MNTNLTQLIDRFAGLHVVVVGDAMLDSYLEGTASALCREAPVPIVALSDRKDMPGGAANTAANVRSLGGRVTFLSVTGDDHEGGLLRQTLERYDVPTDQLLARASRRTLAKHRVMAGAQILVRFDQGSTGPIDRADEQALIDRLADLFPRCDALIVSDYGYGILTPEVIKAIAGLQARMPRILAVDSKHLSTYRSLGVTLVKPNYDETIRLLGGGAFADLGARAEQIAREGERILDLTGAQIAAVTLDSDGALVFERGNPPYRTYARPTHHCHPAGAGDTFVSALALALAAGAHTPAAADLASAAAAIVVAREGTVTCSAEELRHSLSADDKYMPDVSRLVARLERYRQQGRRIVFTNGCFDILHRGHITYLSRAKALGDILIIGVNSDAGIRRLKGPERPINTLEDRVQVLAALSCVDHLIAFDEDTPCELIRAVRPDVFVKGGDYTRATLPEAALVEQQGGIVQILPYLENRSTTAIIERIRTAYAQPGPDEAPLAERSYAA